VFSLFWDQLPNHEIDGERLFKIEDGHNAVMPLSDDEIPSDLAIRAKYRKVFWGIGRLALWSVLQYPPQPVPSAIINRLWLAHAIGLTNVVTGSSGPVDERSKHKLSNAEVVQLLTDLEPGYLTTTSYLLESDAIGQSLHDVSYGLVPEGSDGDGDLIITKENQGQAWRILINHMLADSRQIFLSGFSDGFSGLDLNGGQASCGFTITLHGFMQDFTYQERQREIMSGLETPTGTDIVGILVNEDCPEPNFELLKAILISDEFQPHVQGFLSFVASSKSLLDRSLRITVKQKPQLTADHLPTAATCFQQLSLSAQNYESQAQLQRHLKICALPENCVGFGEK